MSGRSLFAAVLLAAASLASPAGATVRNDPVKLRPVGPLPVLEPGQPAKLSFELATTRLATVSALEVTSGSLSRAFPKRATATSLERDGRPLRLDLDVVATERPDPLLFRYEVEGVPVERRIDLTPLLAGERARREAVVRGPDVPLPVPARPMTRQRPARLEPEAGQPSSGPSVDGDTRTIRVRGRLMYYRGDSAAVGVDRVRYEIFDETPLLGLYSLRAGYTDSYGAFDVEVEWDGGTYGLETDPDLTVRFTTQSPEVRVQDPFFEADYSVKSPVIPDYTGTDLDFGTLFPANPAVHGAFHIYTNIQHNWDWYWYQQSFSLATVDVQWPEEDEISWYNSFWEEIHIAGAATWREDTHAHEYGHHFIENYSNFIAPDYCNGFCDDGECGHCMWCPENSTDAFGEGWPNWIAHVQTSSYGDTYGIASVHTRSAEAVNVCDDTGNYEDPTITEGFIGAILQDIWDDRQEQDAHGFGGRDSLALGTEEIFEVVHLDHPISPMEFLNDFKARFPEHTLALWKTAINNRVQMDLSSPSVPSNLVSTSHTPGVPLMNAQVVLQWTGSTDDWSGIAGYDLYIDHPAPQPDVILNLSASTLAGTGYLPPGTYMLGVRSRDGAGRVSAFTMAGPYVIVAPDPQNLAFTQPAGWARPVVPRPAGDATANSVPNPTQLVGDAASTWLNMALVNNGQTVPNLIFATHTFYVDGSGGNATFNASPDPGVVATRVNRGPITVRGGRHVLGGYLDIFAAWPELDEYDNTWGHQWIWAPSTLAPNVPVRRTAPPGAADGWLLVHDGSTLYDNCDGLRMTGSGWWNAAWIAPDRDTSDYDLNLHFATASVDTGFAVPIATSTREAGELDLVVVNRHVLANAAWDVGVVSRAGDQDTYVARHVESTAFGFGDSLAVAWPDSQYVLLRDVEILASQLGPTVATAFGAPEDGPFWIAALDRTFGAGGLSDGRITLHASDENGRARVEFDAAGAGFYGVLLVRDPVHGRGARNVVLEVERTPCNPALLTDVPGWYAPLVPRPAFDGTAGAVAFPDTLDGTQFSTYLNLRTANPSSVASPFGAAYQVRSDGVTLFSSVVPGIAPGDAYAANIPSPVLVLGGRHTLTATLDPGASLEELEESDNVWGEQWVWGPYVMAPDQPLVWGLPAARTAGWSEVRSGEPLYFNALGMRTPALPPGSAWAAMAVMPGAGSDVDVLLHAPADGVKSGFDVPLAVSGWGVAESEFVLFDVSGPQPPAYDVGIVNVNGAGAGPSALFTRSVPRGAGSHTLQLGVNRTLDLHEFTLAPGVYRVRLTEHTAGVHLGVSVHDPAAPRQSKSDAAAASWVADPGQDEELLFATPTGGTWAVAVWKVSRADLSFDAVYTLEITTETVGVGEESPPAATRLETAAPNPFAATTSLAFSLAAAGDVRLEIFDVTGARVATLADGPMPAGRHRLSWDGAGPGGRKLPAGMYLVRMTAPGHASTRRVVKMK